MPGATKPVAFDRDFTPLPARRLKPKTYIVGGTRESRNAFVGVRDSGPLHPIAECAPLLFLFREHDRDAARRLARALRGTEPGITFGGFERLFRAPLHISSAPVVLRDYSQEEMRQALAHVISQQGLRPLPVLVMPKDEDAYAIHKAVFTHAQVPTQVCTTETIGDDYALKWSVANIALQVFCKAGGQPWKVKPVNERALIIGISQSHRVTHVSGRHHIEKYFAFSVLTDSSGLFRSIEVIGQGNDESSYLGQLRHNLRALLAGNATDFRDVVVHTSFRLKRREMDAIAAVVREASNANRGCRFAIVKVNQKNRFFAVNRGLNSLVPYEGSYLRLGAREFLVWFEGVLPDNPTVSAALPGPTHLEFLKVSEDEAIGDEAILQDLVNLSGANWRGFNARSVPVSMFYCHLIADFLQDFQTRDLPLPDIRDLHPWFL
jgi:argonaute-like protein implicated in RNA metabolism and viral defense